VLKTLCTTFVVSTTLVYAGLSIVNKGTPTKEVSAAINANPVALSVGTVYMGTECSPELCSEPFECGQHTFENCCNTKPSQEACCADCGDPCEWDCLLYWVGGDGGCTWTNGQYWQCIMGCADQEAFECNTPVPGLLTDKFWLKFGYYPED